MDESTALELSHLKSDIQEIKEVVTRLDHSVRGNGHPGLTERVSNLETSSRNRMNMVNLIVSIVAAIAACAAFFK